MVTRDEIKVGDVLVNNDPRKQGQTVTIVALYRRGQDWYAAYQAGSRRAAIRLDRIFKLGELKVPSNAWKITAL